MITPFHPFLRSVCSFHLFSLQVVWCSLAASNGCLNCDALILERPSSEGRVLAGCRCAGGPPPVSGRHSPLLPRDPLARLLDRASPNGRRLSSRLMAGMQSAVRLLGAPADRHTARRVAFAMQAGREMRRKKGVPAKGKQKGAMAVPSAAPTRGARHRSVVRAFVTRWPPIR